MATSLIFDNNSPNFVFDYKSQWTSISGLDQYYGNTLTSVLSETANFTFGFEGTSAAFIGAPPSELQSSGIVLTVTIDNSSSYNISASCANYDCPWYTTPTLTQGPHTITFSNLPLGSIVDFAVVTTSEEAELEDNVILDDNDSSFRFDSGWDTVKENGIMGSYGNGTHWSSTVGSELVLDFVGTSISLYGVASFPRDTLVVSYTLDNGPVQHHNYSNGVDVTLPPNEVSWNYVLFSSTDSLESGHHQLKATIEACVNQTLYVDYAVVSNELGSNVTAGGSSPPAIQPAISPATKVGVIVGSVSGSLILLMLGTVIFLFRKRRRTRAENVYTPSHSLTGSFGYSITDSRWHVDPFTSREADNAASRRYEEKFRNLQERNAEVGRLREQLEQATLGSNASIIEETGESILVLGLRRRIRELTEEIALLQVLAEDLPPDYGAVLHP